MISAIVWVPAGVADPNPKKYEFSPAELELIKMMEEQNLDGETAEVEEEESSVSESEQTPTINLPKIENTLPADLRMDEYSSDEDENDAVQGAAIGNLLVEDDEEENFIEDEEDENHQMKTDDDIDSDDDEDDDDLADVPDTREYTPLDVEGFTSLGLSHVGTNAPSYMEMRGNGEEEDDDSDAEDVQIQAGDAMVVSAKTEDVSSLPRLKCCFRLSDSFVLIRSQLNLLGFCIFGGPCI
jgi:hypothetical protein